MLLVFRYAFAALPAVCRERSELALENIALRHQLEVLSRGRPRLRPADRLLWSWLSRAWPRWRRHLVIVQPDTVVRWHRTAWSKYWRWKSRGAKPGRPRIDPELVELIRQMTRENPRWGHMRVLGELRKLGFHVSLQTVRRYRRDCPRDPSSGWRTFLENHRPETCASDFFTVGKRPDQRGRLGVIQTSRPSPQLSRSEETSACRSGELTRRSHGHPPRLRRGCRSRVLCGSDRGCDRRRWRLAHGRRRALGGWRCGRLGYGRWGGVWGGGRLAPRRWGRRWRRARRRVRGGDAKGRVRDAQRLIFSGRLGALDRAAEYREAVAVRGGFSTGAPVGRAGGRLAGGRLARLAKFVEYIERVRRRRFGSGALLGTVEGAEHGPHAEAGSFGDGGAERGARKPRIAEGGECSALAPALRRWWLESGLRRRRHHTLPHIRNGQDCSALFKPHGPFSSSVATLAERHSREESNPYTTNASEVRVG